MLRKSFIGAVTLATAAIAPSANAEYQWGFANVSINYLDWGSRTTERTGNSSHKDDFAYLELEGGAGFTWGEFYGFADLENPFNGPHDVAGDNQRYTFKATSRIYLGDTGFNLYGHVYGTYSNPQGENNSFHEVNTLYGIGYNTAYKNFWFKPFVALHYVDQTYYSGNNGYVVGWVAGYDFTAWGQKFNITNWNELEFNRAEGYAQGNGKNGINGALGLWWTPVPYLTTGIQYRYADHKLGETFMQDGIVYSLKYNF